MFRGWLFALGVLAALLTPADGYGQWVYRGGQWLERQFCPHCNQEFYSISEACRVIKVMYPDMPLEQQRLVLLGALGLIDKFDGEGPLL